MHASTPAVAESLIALIGLMNDPRRDRRLLAEADLDFDPLLMPLLVRIGIAGGGAVELADHLGRDHSTISRQLAKLEGISLIERATSDRDGRSRPARLSATGRQAFEALASARLRLLDQAMERWSSADRTAFARLFGQFTQSLKTAADGARPPG